MSEQLKGGLAKQIEEEISEYLTGVVEIGEQTDYSQAKLIRRISLFENHIYPTGKFDPQGNYKFWYDIIAPRIDAEVKNIDFDTKNVEAYSSRKQDELPNLIVNLKIREYLRKTGQAEEINSAIEEGSGWGNIVWKKIKGGYERVDLRNFFVINQAARTLKDSPCIERHEFTQSDLRAKKEAWNHIDEVIKEVKSESTSSTIETQGKETTVPHYEIYERNGEVRLSDLKEAKAESFTEEDKEKYVLAKVVAAGAKSEGGDIKIKYIVFSDEISELPYKEYHRSRYKGKWFREGLYELLFDLQVRANQIGNQIAQGLEWASKIIFTSENKTIVQNILTDLANGDLIQGRDIKQLEVRLQGFDQLANDWNRVLEQANDIANSREVVQGITPASGTPLGTTRLLNVNANKLFDFIREKLAIPFSKIFEEWIIPDEVKELKAEEIIRLTGDSDMLERFMNIVVDDWYLRNLISIGPHTQEIAETLKQSKLDELKKRPQLLLKNIEDIWEGYNPNVSVDITGEALKLVEELESLAQFIALESDPIRRSALITMALKKKGIDADSLPSSPPPQPIQPPTRATRALATEVGTV